jgi:O-antigen ligase
MRGTTCLVSGVGAWGRLRAAFRDRKGKQRTRHLIAHGTLLAMVFWLFWMSNSMTSISCFSMAATVIAMTTLFRFARKPIIVHILVATVVGVSFSVLFLNIGGGALETMGRNSTLTGRTVIWQGLLKVGSTANPLFGTGFQSFWVGEHLRKVWSMGGLLNGINGSHNGYLEVFLNLGAIGLTLLAGLLLTGYRNLIKGVRRDPALSTLCLGFFVTAVIYAFTEGSGFGIMNPVWFAFLMAVIQVPNTGIATRRVQYVQSPEKAGTEKELEPQQQEHRWWAGQKSELPENGKNQPVLF